MIGIATQSKIPELAPWIGGVTGAAGTTFAKFQDLKQELYTLYQQKVNYQNKISILNNEIKQLQEQLQYLIVQLEKTK